MIVLGIDQAAVSGWCIAERVERFPRFEGKLIEYGATRKATERRDIVARAVELGRDRGLAVIYEAHTTGGRRVTRSDGSQGDSWNPATILGMGDARGRWLEQLELAEVRPRGIIGVEPRTWRSAMIGGARKSREEWKRIAVLVAKARGAILEPEQRYASDIAEAVLITLWGVIGSAEVAALAQLDAARKAKA